MQLMLFTVNCLAENMAKYKMVFFPGTNSFSPAGSPKCCVFTPLPRIEPKRCLWFCVLRVFCGPQWCLDRHELEPDGGYLHTGHMDDREQGGKEGAWHRVHSRSFR